jgi:hypothetical protein
MEVFVNSQAPIARSRYGEAMIDCHGRHVDHFIPSFYPFQPTLLTGWYLQT